MTKCKAYLAAGMLAGLCAISSGCGGSAQSSITGEVTLDGQPVGPGGHILFVPQSGGEARQASAAIDGGKYEVPAEGAPSLGPCRVEITWDKKTGKKLPSADPGFTMEETREAIPAKYNRDSKLNVEIKSGANVHNFQLQSR